MDIVLGSVTFNEKLEMPATLYYDFAEKKFIEKKVWSLSRLMVVDSK
jgi:hypothetical protein